MYIIKYYIVGMCVRMSGCIFGAYIGTSVVY